VDDSPGADDDGSAIAAELEILRVISPLDLKNTVEFIGFDLEEAGLAGSRAYVVNGIKPYEEIAGLINMDMISYYSMQANSQPYQQDLMRYIQLCMQDSLPTVSVETSLLVRLILIPWQCSACSIPWPLDTFPAC